MVADGKVFVSSDRYGSVWSFPVSGRMSFADYTLYIAGSDGILTAIKAMPQQIVDIDIQPKDTNNVIKLWGKGSVQVALLTTSTFAAVSADPNTVLFAGARPIGWARSDIDRDGDKDIVFTFGIPSLSLTPDATEASLTGKTLPNMAFKGIDMVKVYAPRK